MSRKSVLLLVFFTLGLSFSGCWDYYELETVDFVLGLGLDEIDPDFDLVVETIKVKGSLPLLYSRTRCRAFLQRAEP